MLNLSPLATSFARSNTSLVNGPAELMMSFSELTPTCSIFAENGANWVSACAANSERRCDDSDAVVATFASDKFTTQLTALSRGLSSVPRMASYTLTIQSPMKS